MFLNSQFSHLVLMKLLGGRMLLCFATTHCIPTGSIITLWLHKLPRLGFCLMFDVLFDAYVS